MIYLLDIMRNKKKQQIKKKILNNFIKMIIKTNAVIYLILPKFFPLNTINAYLPYC
jgi:hypothetical protein